MKVMSVHRGAHKAKRKSERRSVKFARGRQALLLQLPFFSIARMEIEDIWTVLLVSDHFITYQVGLGHPPSDNQTVHRAVDMNIYCACGRTW